jgi:hypothetical protein
MSLSTITVMRRLAIIFALVLVLAISAVWLQAHTAVRSVRGPLDSTVIILFRDSRQYTMDNRNPTFAPLRNLLERAIEDSAYGPYESLLPEQLISKSGSAIAIAYARPVSISHHNWNGAEDRMVVDRILLGTTGAYTGWSLSGLGSYRPGPLVTSSATTVASIQAIMAQEEAVEQR